ncbi:MAG: enoyl-ACP reductase FabI [Bacteriovoracaceae bacterium]
MSFLNLENKNFLITGVANKKSVAYFVAKTLLEEKANCYFSVQTVGHKESLLKLFPDSKVYVCNVESDESVKELGLMLKKEDIKFSGFLHSIAFANFSEGVKPFHETKTEDFLQATNISCFSLVNLANQLKDVLETQSSVVTVSISNTRATSYGYLGPIKAALDATVAFLAKSFSEFSQVRFNAVCAGPLKTSASSGIPDYIDNYLYAEQLVLRKKALETQEVANTIVYLLSPASSGMNAGNIVVDGGMASNYFDQAIVKSVANKL